MHMESISDSIVLPVKYPVITSYTHYANLLSIISNNDNSIPWIYNNFINLWGYIKEDGGLPLRFSSYSVKENCPFIEYTKLYPDIIGCFNKNLIELIISLISKGYYIIMHYDQYYLPGSLYYHKNHIQHHFMVYGFDNKARTFNVGDFLNYKNYSYMTISFSEMEQSILSVKEGWPHLCHLELLKPKEYNYTFDTKILKNSLEDYLESRYTVLAYEDKLLKDGEMQQIKNDEIVFGISNYDLLVKNLKSIKQGINKTRDVRPLHAMYDHKILMQHRVEYLQSNSILSTKRDYCKEFTELADKCLENRNLFVKYYLANDNNILDIIIENLESLFLSEKALMLDLLKNIQA